MTNWRTKNLEPQHERQRSDVLWKRASVLLALGGCSPKSPVDAWYVLSGEVLPSRAANQKLYSYWGRLKEEPANGRGKRIAEALGWPEPKRGRPKR